MKPAGPTTDTARARRARGRPPAASRRGGQAASARRADRTGRPGSENDDPVGRQRVRGTGPPPIGGRADTARAGAAVGAQGAERLRRRRTSAATVFAVTAGRPGRRCGSRVGTLPVSACGRVDCTWCMSGSYTGSTGGSRGSRRRRVCGSRSFRCSARTAGSWRRRLVARARTVFAGYRTGSTGTPTRSSMMCASTWSTTWATDVCRPSAAAVFTPTSGLPGGRPGLTSCGSHGSTRAHRWFVGSPRPTGLDDPRSRSAFAAARRVDRFGGARRASPPGSASGVLRRQPCPGGSDMVIGGRERRPGRSPRGTRRPPLPRS